jgi:RNA polymerase sigma-70 factor (ECF subfamily)
VSAAADESDAALATRAAGGDDQAYAALMRRHKASLYSFVRRYIGDPEAALDVLQETFVAAWQAIRRYDGGRPFATWLRAIALNKCRDRGRRLAVRRLVFGATDLDSAEARRQADPQGDAEGELQSAQRFAALDRAIARLPDKLKVPLILTQLEGFSQQAAAEQLGVSVKTIETRIYRARRRLAGELGDLEI